MTHLGPNLFGVAMTLSLSGFFAILPNGDAMSHGAAATFLLLAVAGIAMTIDDIRRDI